MNYEWNPERQYIFTSGKYTMDIKMSLEERISTYQYECENKQETDPHQCLSDFYMSKLGCSFPWDVQNSKENCTEASHVTHLRKLVAEMANTDSEMRKEFKALDCMIPKCNESSWDVISTRNDQINQNGTAIQVMLHSITGVRYDMYLRSFWGFFSFNCFRC